MGSQLKEAADRRCISLLMHGCQVPIMSRPHSGRTRNISSHQSSCVPERLNGSNSGKGNKESKSAVDPRNLRPESDNYGVYEESSLRSAFACSSGHNFTQNGELSAALLSCSTTLDDRNRGQTVGDQVTTCKNSKMRPHTAHASSDKKTKSSSWIGVKKEDEKLNTKASRVKGSNRKVLHRTLSISSLPDRMNFGKVPSHRKNRVPMLNCYCLNDDLNTDALPKIIDAASYAKSKADQRKSSLADSDLTKKTCDSLEKVNNVEAPSEVEVPAQVHLLSETPPKVTKMASLLPLMGFKLGQNEAASRIQKWYKRHSARRKAADAALRRMKSSPSASVLRKAPSRHSKLLDESSSSSSYLNQLHVSDFSHNDINSSDLNASSTLQRKKSSIALHVVQSNGVAHQFSGLQESSQHTSQKSWVKPPVPKERRAVNRRRKSEGDVSNYQRNAVSVADSNCPSNTEQRRRSLSDGALKAECDGLNSFHRPPTPKKTACLPNRNVTIRCNSASRAHRSRVEHVSDSKVKSGILSEKGEFSNDSLECMQNGHSIIETDKGNVVVRISDNLHEDQVDIAFNNFLLRRPSDDDDEAVIIRPLPSEPTSDSAPSSSNEIVNGEQLPREVNYQYSRLQNHVERLLLRPTSREEESPSPQTAMTSINSEACTVDSLDCGLKRVQSLIPVGHSSEKVTIPFHNPSKPVMDNSGNCEKEISCCIWMKLKIQMTYPMYGQELLCQSRLLLHVEGK